MTTSTINKSAIGNTANRLIVESPAEAPPKEVGRRVPQHGSVERVRGEAVYTHDVTLPGMLYAAILRSPHAHARIKRIDVERAKAAPGVHAVVTSDDFPRIKYVHFGAKYSDRYPLALDKVRFVGEEVAAVAATSLAEALDAVRMIAVEYEPLPVLMSPDDAMAPDAIDIHDRELTAAGKNIAQYRSADYGDVQAAFDKAEHVFEDVFEHGIVVPGCMETNGTVASFDEESGVLTLWTATQAPHFVRKEVGHVLEIPIERIHVRGVEVGGGFGGKSKICEQEAIAALLSIRTRRPVKLTLDRTEEFLSGKTDHAKRMRVRTAVDAAGNILARSTSVVVDNGAYTAFGPVYTAACRARTTSLYRVGTARFESKLVYTNKVPGGQYRGMGAPQTIWAIESQIDRIADELSIDPLEYRIAIANRTGDTTPLGWQITSCALAECLAEVGKRIGWEEKRRDPKPWRGVGVASMIHPSGGVLYEEGNFSNTRIELAASGRYRLYTQTSDTGTWQNTILAQLAADALGVPSEEVSVHHMDTGTAPSDLGSAASRVTFVTGNATVVAAKALHQKLVEQIAAIWACDPSAVSLAQGEAFDKSNPARRLSLAQFVAENGPQSCDGRYSVPAQRPHPETGYGNYAAAYTFGAQAVEVEVDPATGRIKILKIVAAMDVGKAINPTAIEGQIQGGIVQGIGMTLQEELVYEDNRPVNANFLNYRIPRIGDAPPIEVAIFESDEHEGPFGAKAAGEPSINPTVAAIANAVAHATGIRFNKLPLRPDYVLSELAKRDQRKLSLKPYKRPYNLEVATVRSLYPAVVFPALREVGTKFAKTPRKCVKPDVVVAQDLDDLVGQLAPSDRKTRILAGGTDLFVGLKQGIYDPDVLIDIGNVDELRGISRDGAVLRLGGGTPLSQVADSEIVNQLIPMLAQGIRCIATPQIRNMATIAGDLCQEKRCWFFRSALPCYKLGGSTCPCFAVLGDNRHHSIMGASRCAAPCPADLAPILTALDARVVAASRHGVRHIRMEDFYLWSGLTSLRLDEVLLHVEIPLVRQSTHAFEKFALRQGDFAEASVAASLVWEKDRIMEARISLGAVSPLPMRATGTEAHLMRHGYTAEAIRAAAKKAVHGSLPLSDNAHKTHLLVELAERAITRAVAER
jgi:CO/xanthine dehydrogenase Mo-binding subunit/CO/xanthine dehydrogenase FAD-binding subunit